MGVVPNITHDTFPVQGDDLGKKIRAILNDKRTSATIVRSDIESPLRKIYKTEDGTYLIDLELTGFPFPKQSQEYLGRRTEVCFHYDTGNTLEGTIVRDDSSEPYKTLIHLDDGRVIEAGECQYSPMADNVDKIHEPKEYIEITKLKSKLKRLKSSNRMKHLHGIYKQLIPNKKGKVTNGYYNTLLKGIPKNFNGTDSETILEQIIERVQMMRLIDYVSEEMQKNDHLKHHASKLKETYLGLLKVNIPKIERNTYSSN